MKCNCILYHLKQFCLILVLFSPAVFLVNCSRVAFSTAAQNAASQGQGTVNNNGPSGGGSNPPVPPTCTMSTTNTPVVNTLPPGVTQSMLTGICPAVASNSDCTAVIIVTDSGVYLYYNPKEPSADDGAGYGSGFDDTMVGVLNMSSSTTIKTLGLNSNNDIFGFDGDGIDTFIGRTNVTGSVTNFNTNATDTTGYGGPNAYYSFQSGCTLDTNSNAYIASKNSPNACDGGVVNFVNPIAPGGSTFFGLENALSSASACLSTQVN